MVDSSKMKIKLKTYLDRVFPELETMVDVNSNAIRAILKEFPTAKRIANTRIDKLKSLASDASKGKYSLSKIELVKETAKSSIGIDSDSIGLNIIQCIETLELKERQIDSINTALTNHPLVIDSPLHHIRAYLNNLLPLLDILVVLACQVPDCLIFGSSPAYATSLFEESNRFILIMADMI